MKYILFSLPFPAVKEPANAPVVRIAIAQYPAVPAPIVSVPMSDAQMAAARIDTARLIDAPTATTPAPEAPVLVLFGFPIPFSPFPKHYSTSGIKRTGTNP